MYNIFDVVTKKVSCTYLDGLGLKFFLHWKANTSILSKSSQTCFVVVFGSFFIANTEVWFGKVLRVIEGFQERERGRKKAPQNLGLLNK